jgi:hypothetical protein
MNPASVTAQLILHEVRYPLSFSYQEMSVLVLTHLQHDFLIEGVFELRPSLPKYQDTWDISVVLKVLEEWKLEDSSLKVLSLKLSMLFAITTSQRLQTLKALCINKMNLKSDQCSFEIDVLLKTSQPGKHLNKVGDSSLSG